MALIVIDFDQTIVDGHTHSLITRTILSGRIAPEDREAQWALVKQMSALGGSAKWKEVFQSLLEKNHDVAIASFNSYPHIISRFLREVIGLNDDEIARIHINSWLPADPRSADKNDHIEQIISHFYPGFGERPRRDQVVLVDDSDNNIIAAEIAEFRTVRVDNDLAFFGELNRLIADLGVDASRAAAPGFKR